MPGIGIGLGLALGGGGGGAGITPATITLDPAATGAIGTLRSGLSGTLTWSKLSGASALAIASATGVLTLSVALGTGGSASATFRVQNTTGDAIERTIALNAVTPAPSPTPSPTPTPTPTPTSALNPVIVHDGTSWSAASGDDTHFVGHYQNQRPNLAFVNQAVGGSILGTSSDTIGSNSLYGRLPLIWQIKPYMVVLENGANDLSNRTFFPTDQSYIDALTALVNLITSTLVGCKVVLCTIGPQYISGNAGNNADFSSSGRRGVVNAAIRAMKTAGTIYDVVDLAADSHIGPDSAALDTTVFEGPPSSIHLTPRTGSTGGHDYAYAVYQPVLDAAVTALTAPTGEIPAPAGLTLASTSGSAPMAINVPIDAAWFPGMYWDEQRAASTGAFTAATRFSTALPTLTGEGIQQITPQDLASGAVTLSNLSTTPAGLNAVRVRVGKDDGQGGYIWSGWSNVVTDTITALTTFATSNSASKGDAVTITNAGLTAAGNGTGTHSSAVRATQSRAGKRHYEFTINAATGGIEYGIDDGTLDFSGYPPHAGNGSNKGFAIDQYNDLWINGSFSNTPGNASIAVNDVFVVEFDTTANTFTVWRIRSGSTTTVISTTMTSSVPTNWFPFVITPNGTQITINFLGTTTPFTKALSSGYQAYDS